jgi:hypothetical protein
MKILEFKRSGIRIIAEFCKILSGFPNQGRQQRSTTAGCNVDGGGGGSRD